MRAFLQVQRTHPMDTAKHFYPFYDDDDDGDDNNASTINCQF